MRAKKLAASSLRKEFASRVQSNDVGRKEFAELAQRLPLRLVRSQFDLIASGALDRGVNLRAMDRNVRGSLDAEANFVSANIHDRHDDVVANHNLFITFTGEDEHGQNLPW